MPTVAEHLTALVQAAAEAAGHAEAPVPLDPCVATRDPSHGDYQSNFAFRLGKALRTNPRAVAEQIKAALPPDPAVARAEVAGPGFLNFFLDEQWLAGRLKQGIQGPERSGRTMVLDYSSPNIAKRMHVGHLRSTIIGAALHRLYSWLGWTVIADNHLGDWGTPIGKLIVAWKRWRDPAAYEADPIGELQRLYEQASAASKDDPEFLQAARAETVLLQQGDAANMSLWTEFMRATRVELDQIYGRLDISFDAWLGESAYRDRLDALVGELLAAGIAVESEGAVIVPLEGNLSDHPLLVRKADGGMLYGTTDLATIRHRIETWDPERIVYVTDTRQQLHFQQVFAAAKKMGMSGPGLVHVWFGMLKDPTGQVAAAREGGAVNLVEVLDTAAAKAFEVVTEKSPDLPEEERRQIAEAVGVGTIKYFDLSQNPQSDITFSWEKALSLDGGSAVYLMYAYARLHSILRGGGAAGVPPDVLPAVEHPAERALAALAVRTPEAVATAAEAYRPNLLAEHLDALAKAVGPFYEHCPVLKEGVDPDVRARRLALVHGVAQALEVGLSLLGIRAIPRM